MLQEFKNIVSHRRLKWLGPLARMPDENFVVQALLTGGTTYFIVVSGYGSDAGPYQINVTATNGQVVSGLPIKGRYALAQSSCITSASSNGTASGERRTLLTCKCQKHLRRRRRRRRHYIFSSQTLG